MVGYKNVEYKEIVEFISQEVYYLNKQLYS